MLFANPGAKAAAGFALPPRNARTLHASRDAGAALAQGELPPWSVVWLIARGG